MLTPTYAKTLQVQMNNVGTNVYQMNFHVLSFVLIVFLWNRAGAGAGTFCPEPGAGAGAAGTIDSDPGAGGRIVPRSRIRSKCGRLRIPGHPNFASNSPMISALIAT